MLSYRQYFLHRFVSKSKVLKNVNVINKQIAVHSWTSSLGRFLQCVARARQQQLRMSEEELTQR